MIFFGSKIKTDERWKGREERRRSPFIGIGQMNPNRWIASASKTRVEIKQNNQW